MPRSTRCRRLLSPGRVRTRPVASCAFSDSRQFLVNGRPFVFRAGGWSENLLLHYSAADIARQIQMIKNLGLNGIRTEGKQMPHDFYEQMDRAGILIDAGFQCCDVWDFQSIGLKKPTAHDYKIIATRHWRSHRTCATTPV